MAASRERVSAGTRVAEGLPRDVTPPGRRLFCAALIAALVALDDESNWMEGAQLLVVYIILAMAFFFLPA